MPSGLSKPVRDAWAAFWTSPLRDLVDEVDLISLHRLFELYERRIRFDREGMRRTVVTGSTGQETLNPLLKEIDTIDTKILALEDRFGMNPQSRIKLSVKLNDARKSIAATNAALAASNGRSDDRQPAEDPRRLAARR